MSKLFTLTIEGTNVIFDMNRYTETIEVGLTPDQLNAIYDNPDYKLLHNYKMAKYAYDKDLEPGDIIADKYLDKYEYLSKEVKERFPQIFQD